MDRLETVCYISPVETRQIAVSFIAKHEESDLSLLIYADKTIYSVAVLNISLEGNHNKTVRKSVFVPLSSPFLSFPVHPTPFSSPNSFFRICIIVLRCICVFHFELYMYIDCMLTMLMPYVIQLSGYSSRQFSVINLRTIYLHLFHTSVSPPYFSLTRI